MKSHCSSVSRHLIILQPINQVFWQKFERRRSNTCLLAYLRNYHPWHWWHDKSDHSGYSSFSHHYSGWIDFNTGTIRRAEGMDFLIHHDLGKLLGRRGSTTTHNTFPLGSVCIQYFSVGFVATAFTALGMCITEAI